VADGVALEQAGRPAVTVVGEPFARAAEIKKKTLGLPAFDLVVVPVPRSREAAAAVAKRAAEAVVAALTTALTSPRGHPTASPLPILGEGESPSEVFSATNPRGNRDTSEPNSPSPNPGRGGRGVRADA
jgi:hypothetical protein